MKTIIATLSLTLSLSAMAAANYTCTGTEPFWSATVKGSRFTLDYVGNYCPTTEKITSRISASGMVDGYAEMISTATVTAAITTAECNDGMSDNTYSHTILLKTDETVLYGCCSVTK